MGPKTWGDIIYPDTVASGWKTKIIVERQIGVERIQKHGAR